jgi:lipopolysaccharide export system permease protein
MGTLLANYNLTRHSESVIISGAGLSPFGGIKSFAIAAALIGAFAAAVVNPYAVRVGNGSIDADSLSLIDGAIWLRDAGADGVHILRAANMNRDGGNVVFKDVTVLRQDSDSNLTERIEAAKMTLSESGLSADSAKVFGASGWRAKKAKWSAKIGISPQAVLDRYLQPEQMSFWKLPQFIKEMQKTGANMRSHAVRFWTLLFLPLTLVAMVFLATAFSQTRERRGHKFGTKFGIGILTCFALYFIVNLFGTIGASGGLPAFLSVIAPPIIIIAASGSFIVSFENM